MVYIGALYQIRPWNLAKQGILRKLNIQFIPRHMHTVFALLCFVVVIHWLIFPYPSGLLHWHCGNLTIAPVPAKQPWWIWINTSCAFIMNDCITKTKQSTTKPCAYLLGYILYICNTCNIYNIYIYAITIHHIVIQEHAIRKVVWNSPLNLLRPFYFLELTLIPAWISNYTHYIMWDEVTYPFPNFKRSTVEAWELMNNFITLFTGCVITYPC